MIWSNGWRTGILPGAMAGLIGGVVFGLTLLELGLLPAIAQLVRVNSTVVGFVVHMAAAGIIGAGFGFWVWHQRPGTGETLYWGLAYGAFWWYLGPLTLLPLMTGENLTWDVGSAREALPWLLGHILYGGSTGLAVVFFRWQRRVHGASTRLMGGALARGAIAGLLSAGLLGVCLSAQDQLLSSIAPAANEPRIVAWMVTLLIGVLAGVEFALLYPDPADGAGPGLIRGSVHGFLWWILAPLTLVPLLGGDGLFWGSDDVQQVFATLPGYILFGAGVALFYQWLTGLVRLLFSDLIVGGEHEGIGSQGLRILGRTVLGGLVGGLLFALIMLQTDFLPSVADLIGTTSQVAGFFVNLAIAQLVGASYGLLFRRQSYGIGSALGWGVSYGFFWSILGPLTLMTVFLGSTPQWTAEAVAGVFPSLIGHLVYGAGLGVTFYLLEARYNPWWITRTQAQAELVARRRDQALSSGPAVWAIVIMIGLTLPILLGKIVEGAPGYG